MHFRTVHNEVVGSHVCVMIVRKVSCMVEC